MLVRMLVAAVVITLWAGAGVSADEGYRRTYTRIATNRAEHWQAWDRAVGASVIEADGTVRPRFLRRDINAMINAHEFLTVVAGHDTVQGGVLWAGSNPDDAPNIMDGDLRTWWEPSLQDSVDQWSVEVSLGRAVIARSVRVRFSETGDPFLKFRVMLADGREGMGGRRGLSYYRVGSVTRPNRTQREFVFDVRPRRPVPEGVAGEVTQVIRIDVLDTAGPRAAEVSAQEYPHLSTADRGATDHYRQTVIGRLIRVDAEAYAELPDEERGPIRHFRRERPRLAELEVITQGDNVINLTQRIRNRDMSVFDNILMYFTTDGMYPSSYRMYVYEPVRDRYQLEIDLGARFWLDRVRMLSAGRGLMAYQVRVSDGSLDPAGALIWTVFPERENRDALWQLEEQFDLREVRFIELRRLPISGSDNKENGRLNEIQAYGEGYVTDVTLTSPYIRLNRAQMVTAVSWDADVPVGTRLDVRTRSGNELLETTRYYSSRGVELTEDEWLSMSEQWRGDVVTLVEQGSDWSDWGELYEAPGDPFRSPNPRRYLQAQLRLQTREPLRAVALRALELRLAPPLVDAIPAEIHPSRNVPPGVDREFTFYLKPLFAAGNVGFDRIRLRSSSSAPVELLSVHAGDDDALRHGGARQLWPGALAASVCTDGVELVLPEPVNSGRRVYAIRFRTRVFLSGTTFTAEVAHPDRPGVVQSVSEGDASSLTASQSLVVISDLGEADLLEEVRVTPSVLTPNLDGVNDQTTIEFAVYRLKGLHRLQVTIHDLSGRLVRDLSLQRPNPSGQHRVPWDGRDHSGRLVTPGTYLARVRFRVDAAGEDTEAVKVLHVAY